MAPMTVPPRLSALLAVPLAISALVACSSSTADPAAEGQLTVATTVAPITSIVAAVAGDRAAIEGIVPEGVNSHTFEPPPRVAQLLSRADVVFINGLKLEEPTRDLAEENLKDGAQIVELGTAVLPEDQWIYDFSFPEEGGKPNPHLWTNPLYAIKYAAVVRDTLSELDPAGAVTYAANYDSFEEQATELSDALRKDQESIPGARALLTYHDAYAYFGEDYGWDIIGAVQPENFEDPTAAEVAEIIRQVQEQQVPTIFGSEVFPSEVLEEIGRATGARYEDTLRDDDLPGVPGEPEHSWLGLMRYDYVTMIEGLGGSASALKAMSTRPAIPDRATYPQ